MKKDLNKENCEKFAKMILKDQQEEIYKNNRAIEHAMKKLGMGWKSNRQRLCFYEYFNEYKEMI